MSRVSIGTSPPVKAPLTARNTPAAAETPSPRSHCVQNRAQLALRQLRSTAFHALAQCFHVLPAAGALSAVMPSSKAKPEKRPHEHAEHGAETVSSAVMDIRIGVTAILLVALGRKCRTSSVTLRTSAFIHTGQTWLCSRRSRRR